MNVLALWTLDAETKVEVVAFLGYPLSVVCLVHLRLLLLLLLFIACVLLAHLLKYLRILAMLHSLVHSVELNLVVIVSINSSSTSIVIVVYIKVLVRALSH
jgi:hypothetical protein